MKRIVIISLACLYVISVSCSVADNLVTPNNATNRIGQADVFCPTDNEQAKQFYNDAIIMQERGKYSEAKQLFLKAIELDPLYCDAMDNLGQMLRSQGNVEEAITWYTKSIEIYPSNIVAHQNLAVAYRAQGDFDSALEEGQLLVDMDPDNPEGYYGLGMSYLSINEPQEALTHLKEAEEFYRRNSSPYVTDARYLIGVAHYMLENCEQAIDYFESVYSDMRLNPEINYILGLCYLTPQLENMELSKKYLSRAQELGKQIPEDVFEQIEE